MWGFGCSVFVRLVDLFDSGDRLLGAAVVGGEGFVHFGVLGVGMDSGTPHIINYIATCLPY